MPTQRHPFPNKLEKNLLEAVADRGSVDIFNGLMDKAGAIHKRPGLSFCQTLPGMGGVQALYWWNAKQKLVAVIGGQVYAADSASETLTQVSNYAAQLTLGPAKIVDTGYWLYICGSGGHIVQWNGTDPAIKVPDGVAPTNVSTLAVVNGRVIANEIGTNRFWFTRPPSLQQPQDALVWEAYLEVGRTNESVIGLEVSGGELIAFKRDMFQGYYDDGVTPFRPITGAQQFYGLISASALAKYENALYFVSPLRTVYQLLNREVKNISFGGLDTALRKINNLTDARVHGIDRFVVFTFPTDQKTFVYDTMLETWTQFTSFKDGIETDFISRCATNLPAAGASNLWLIGGRDNKLYFWEQLTYTDDEQPIRFAVRTAHQDWGSLNRKATTRLVLKLSTESLGTIDVPDISFPAATRCSLYNHEITLPVGVTVTITGLPSGVSASQVGQTLTISGAVSDFVGNADIIVTVKDTFGRTVRVPKSFIVNDFDIDTGVL